MSFPPINNTIFPSSAAEHQHFATSTANDTLNKEKDGAEHPNEYPQNNYMEVSKDKY